MWDFLEMLPLSELSNRIEATLTVRLVVDRCIHGYMGLRCDISLDVGEQPPPTMGSFYSERVIIQTGTTRHSLSLENWVRSNHLQLDTLGSPGNVVLNNTVPLG